MNSPAELSPNARILYLGSSAKEIDSLEQRIRSIGYEFTAIGFDQDLKQEIKWKKPDLLLIDVDRGDWFAHDILDFLKNHLDRSIPVMVIVYINDYDTIQDGVKLDVSEFIIKPVNWTLMKTRISKVLATHHLASDCRTINTRFTQIQKMSGVGTWEIGARHSTISCSEGISYILELPKYAEEMELKQFLKFVHPEDRDDVANLLHQSINRLYPFKRDHRVILADGTEKIVDHQVFMVLDKTTKKRKVVGIIQDITVRKLSEYLEQDRSRVLEMIVRNESLPSIFKEIIHIVDRQKAETASIIISMLNQKKLRVQAASSNLPEDFIKALDNQAVGPKSGAQGAGAYLGDVVSTSNIAESPMWASASKIALTHGLNACYAYPILSSKGEVFGVISIFYRHVCVMSDTDSYLLKILTNLASIAIERIRMSRQLLYHARHDSLTGLPNRFSLSEKMNEFAERSKRYNEKMAFMFIDLDRFKQVNDSLGHKVGDILLQKVAKRIADLARKTDMVARVGGDEFIQVLTKIGSKEDMALVAQRIIDDISKPYYVQKHELYVGASIGISIFPDDTGDPAQLQKFADIAMYYAKNKGKGRFHFFKPGMDDKAISRLEIENDLRKALERKEFELFYQPQFMLKDRKLIGFEALIRWNHPEYGRISPDSFIPIAEKSELIIPIGTWVLEEACRQNAAWEKAGYGPFRIAVNVSVVQFLEPDFLQIIKQTLKTYHLQPQRLEIEITESVVVEDIKEVSKILSAIRDLGVHTAIDDFGSGYSSMSYIENLPVTSIKIDQAFVRKVGSENESDEKSKILLESITTLAAKLNMKSIAEGFETESQYRYLKEIGCDIGQGYYLGMPMSVDDIEMHCQNDLACTLEPGLLGIK
ncbi:MAG: EAL domain-containing protein [Desulfobacteraceae bacterium]|jgi:diguanylate cyclase (GGDEF)-like protein/PAS domain S-box-containing protein|nr:EAL domain-containing protein [Desulfobacteraceae bacterium]